MVDDSSRAQPSDLGVPVASGCLFFYVHSLKTTLVVSQMTQSWNKKTWHAIGKDNTGFFMRSTSVCPSTSASSYPLEIRTAVDQELA